MSSTQEIREILEKAKNLNLDVEFGTNESPTQHLHLCIEKNKGREWRIHHVGEEFVRLVSYEGRTEISTMKYIKISGIEQVTIHLRTMPSEAITAFLK